VGLRMRENCFLLLLHKYALVVLQESIAQNVLKFVQFGWLFVISNRKQRVAKRSCQCLIGVLVGCKLMFQRNVEFAMVKSTKFRADCAISFTPVA
jgi:hypothetical protein